MTNPRDVRGPRPEPRPNFSTSTSTGIEPNVAAALSYALGLITGIVFYLLEKENRYVRFHAAQSITVSLLIIVLSIGVSILSGILVFIPILGWIAVLLLTLGLSIGTFVLWILLMVKAYKGQEWEVPIAGGFARRMM